MGLNLDLEITGGGLVGSRIGELQSKLACPLRISSAWSSLDRIRVIFLRRKLTTNPRLVRKRLELSQSLRKYFSHKIIITS